MRLAGVFLGLMLGCNNTELEAKNADLTAKVTSRETEKARLGRENDALGNLAFNFYVGNFCFSADFSATGFDCVG